MDRLRRFMYGRYGFDQLTRTLLIATLIISLSGSIFRSSIVIVLSYIPLGYGIFRSLSKNISKRSQENYRYLNFTGMLKRRFQRNNQKFVGTKTHKYYKCPNCKQMIRVPRGKGKICITCPKCRKEFVKRT
jgi:hypothetical protein